MNLLKNAAELNLAYHFWHTCQAFDHKGLYLCTVRHLGGSEPLRVEIWDDNGRLWQPATFEETQTYSHLPIAREA